MTDEDLLARARDGDEDAFLALYRRYRDPLFRFAWRMAVDAAEDFVHDFFLSLWKRNNGYSEARGPLRPYLDGAVRNLALKRLRVSCREERSEEVDNGAGEWRDGLEALMVEDLAVRVQSAVAALPPSYREVLVLSDYEGLTMAEVASVTGAEVGNVKVRLHRARQKVRKQLAEIAHERR